MSLAVTKENPFRVGTKLYRIFEYMKDGEYRSLRDIVIATYKSVCPCGGSKDCFLLKADCRRAGSALRTIRAVPGLAVNVWYRGDYNQPVCYRMVG